MQVRNEGRGTYEITGEVSDYVHHAGVTTGLAHLFIQHTSASLIICENADPLVRRDLETFMLQTVPGTQCLFIVMKDPMICLRTYGRSLPKML